VSARPLGLTAASRAAAAVAGTALGLYIVISQDTSGGHHDDHGDDHAEKHEEDDAPAEDDAAAETDAEDNAKTEPQDDADEKKATKANSAEKETQSPDKSAVVSVSIHASWP